MKSPFPPPAKVESSQKNDDAASGANSSNTLTRVLVTPPVSDNVSGSASSDKTFGTGSATGKNSKTGADSSAETTEKSSFVSKLNPMRWFRSEPKSGSATTPLARTNAPTTTLAATARTNQPALTVKPATNPAPIIKPIPAIARYPYLNPPKPAAGNRNEANRLLQEGTQNYQNGRLDLAIAAYKKASQADPSLFDAHYNCGCAAFELKDIPTALLEQEQALTIQPDSFNARFNFALALEKANYPRDAANELEKLLLGAQSDPRLHFLLGNLYAQKLYQPQQAKTHYLKLLELDPRNPSAGNIRFWLANHP